MLKEFKEFAMKGNLVDIAVGFVMGAAFNNMVTKFTGGIISPLVGMIFNTDFNAMQYKLSDGKEVVVDGLKTFPEPVYMKYGEFLTSVLDFIILAFVMFMVVKGINNMQKKEEEVAETPANEVLLGEIRDLLKK